MYKASPKMSSPVMATINVLNGLNAVMKTGPFSLIANVWTYTVIPKITTPWKKKYYIISFSEI